MISLRAYARRRGCNANAVSQAVKMGTLVLSVTRDANGQPKISDPDLADQEWAANVNRSKAPKAVIEKAADLEDGALSSPEPGTSPQIRPGSTLSEANAAHAYWKAQNEELKFREASGELVEAKTVEHEWADVAARIKTKLLGVPSRAKQALPDLSVSQVAALDSLLREVLEELADDR